MSDIENIERLSNVRKAQGSIAETEICIGKPISKPGVSEAAFHGLAGKFIEIVLPHTESDSAALLIQFLTAFGNVIGRTAFVPIEADRHYSNLFVVAVGDSSKGRKGTSLGYIRKAFEGLDFEWETDRIKSGLSTGEGLIWAVRDPIERAEKNTENGAEDFVLKMIDPGISDKRLLITETEFASVLRVIERDGNKLSAIIRDAWDKGILRSLTKNEAAQASNAHISIIGHITKTELLRYLKFTETANGFGNRFLWYCVERSKRLPFGGQVPEEPFRQMKEELRRSVDCAKTRGQITFDDEAKTAWVDLYDLMAVDKPGVYGAMTARGEPQVLRLALIYALLDKSKTIQVVHLEAAVAVWDYCEQSCKYIFGEATGDPVADQILSELRSRPEGLTQTQIIEDIFNRHKKRHEISRAFQILLSFNLIRHLTETSDKGRAQTRWIFNDVVSGETCVLNEALNENSPNSQLSPA